MRALVKSRSEPGIWMEDLPVPEPGPGEVLVHVRRSSICGSDLHFWDWDRVAWSLIPVPMIMGHEFTGTIARVGRDVVGFGEGQRIGVEGHVTCGKCHNCRAGPRHLCPNTKIIGVQRPGGAAEYVAVPATNAYVLPESLPDDVASCLDPFGNAVHCAMSFAIAGKDVLITGAGPIGVLAAAVARFAGARRVMVTDVSEYRLNLARKLGATETVNVANETLDAAMRALGIDGFDVGLEMSGAASALRPLLAAMHYGGKVALLGICAEDIATDWSVVVLHGLTVKGIYGREMFGTWYQMSALLEAGLDISPVITHRFPASRFADAYAMVRSGLSGKVVLDWSVS
jgi:threonine 3-dehydrogenase